MPTHTRDSKGRFTSTDLGTEEATRLGSIPKTPKVQKEAAEELLKEAGYDNPVDAPTRTKLMAKEAAKGNTTAIKSFGTKEEAKDLKLQAVAEGEKCPTCGQYNLADMQINDDELDSIIDGLDL